MVSCDCDSVVTLEWIPVVFSALRFVGSLLQPPERKDPTPSGHFFLCTFLALPRAGAEFASLVLESGLFRKPALSGWDAVLRPSPSTEKTLPRHRPPFNLRCR